MQEVKTKLLEQRAVFHNRTWIKYLFALSLLVATLLIYSRTRPEKEKILHNHVSFVRSETPTPLPAPISSVWNPSPITRKNAIATLFDQNVHLLAPKIAVLDTLLADNMSTDVIIFHTGYPYINEIDALVNVTRRRVILYNIDSIYSTFPKGFDPYLEKPNWSKRGKWNYHHMCRFWFKLVLEIPLVQKYEFVMRLDDDSKLMGPWFNVFEFMRNKSAVNFANVEQEDYEAVLPGLMNLKSFTLQYQEKYRVVPKNPARLARGLAANDRILLHNTNFDIFKVDFFRSGPVAHWINAVDESYGIFRYRWGDHLLRFLTTALFATPSEVLMRLDYNLSYCHPC